MGASKQGEFTAKLAKLSGAKVNPEELAKLIGGGITAEFAESLRRRVLDACRLGGDGDPLSADVGVRETGKAWYRAVTSYLMAHKWLLPATGLLYELWDRYAKMQRGKKARVDRAFISQLLTEVTHAAGRHGEALRWSLLTQADDVLGEHEEGGGHVRH